MRVSLRDSWDKEDAPVQQALSGLKDVLGIKVIIKAEWSLLLAELDSFYPDKGTFVPSVASCAQALFVAFGALLEDAHNAKWADELLERTKRPLTIFLEVMIQVIRFLIGLVANMIIYFSTGVRWQKTHTSLVRGERGVHLRPA